MATVKSFEELEIWQLSREICQEVWDVFERTTLGKDFELKNQMNRSSGSIMDNIAEGFERNGRKEFIQFLSYSKGSCGELRSQLYRA
jgi:four helix bundle protein